MKFQAIEIPRFLDNRYMNVVRFSALNTGQFSPEKIILVITSVRDRVQPSSIVRQE
jgi:hypothetical protein